MAVYIPQEVFLDIIQAVENAHDIALFIEDDVCVIYNPHTISSEDAEFEDWFHNATPVTMDDAPDGIYDVVPYRTEEF